MGERRSSESSDKQIFKPKSVDNINDLSQGQELSIMKVKEVQKKNQGNMYICFFVHFL